MIKFFLRCLLINIVINIFIFTHVNADQTQFKNNSVSLNTVSSTTKIIGGTKADSNEYPWMTALIYSDVEASVGQFCGGSLIASQWVLTAGHCVYELSADELEVLIGQSQLSGSGGERIAVDRIVVLPGYNPSTDFGDIALLHLAQPSNQNPVDIITRVQRPLIMPFESATIIGWGNMSTFGHDYPDDLMEAEVMMLPFGFGSSSYGSLFIAPGMIVAGYIRGDIDSCDGDSGGPLVVLNEAQTDWVLAGITSWGEGCARPYAPGVYTNVLFFSRWIIRVIASE